MPIDLDISETFLFRFADDRGTFVVAVPARTDSEARIRYARMSPAEKRAASVGRIGGHDRDLVAEFFTWLASLTTTRRRPA